MINIHGGRRLSTGERIFTRSSAVTLVSAYQLVNAVFADARTRDRLIGRLTSVSSTAFLCLPMLVQLSVRFYGRLSLISCGYLIFAFFSPSCGASVNNNCTYRRLYRLRLHRQRVIIIIIYNIAVLYRYYYRVWRLDLLSNFLFLLLSSIPTVLWMSFREHHGTTGLNNSSPNSNMSQSQHSRETAIHLISGG